MGRGRCHPSPLLTFAYRSPPWYKFLSLPSLPLLLKKNHARIALFLLFALFRACITNILADPLLCRLRFIGNYQSIELFFSSVFLGKLSLSISHELSVPYNAPRE